MSQTIKITNFHPLNLRERGALSADCAVNASSLSVLNSQDFALYDYVMVGHLGNEESELVTVNDTVSATTSLPVSATKFAHDENEPIVALFGNQIQIYRAPNVDGTQPADDQFEALGSPFDIDTDQLETSYTDPAGGSGYWYKFTYRNEVTGNETNLADSPAVRGGGSGDYTTVDLIRNEARFNNNQNITDAMIDEKRQAARSVIDSKLGTRYVVPFTEPINEYVTDLNTRLAANYLLRQQYGETQAIKDAIAGIMSELNDIQTGETSLTGETGVPEAAATSGPRFNGWPNASTAAATREQAGGDHLFRISDVNGQGRY